jgi:hypothetical protein
MPLGGNMLALPSILTDNGFIIHAYDWEESSKSKAMISVAKRINNDFAKQVANIGIESGSVRFYSGNGYTATDRKTFYSTFLDDEDKEKFIKDFNAFIDKMQVDPYSSGGFLIKKISDY